MKIIIINNMFPPEGTGGAERFVENQAVSLVKEGHDVVVVAGSKKNKREFYQNYKIVRFKPRNIYNLLDASKHNILTRSLWTIIDVWNIGTYLQLKKIILRERPNMIICHNLKGIGYLTPDLIRVHGIKYIQYIHDVQLAVPSGVLYADIKMWHTNGILQKIYTRIIRGLMGSPDEVISLSEWLLTYYTSQKFFKDSKMSVLPFSISTFDKAEILKNLNRFVIKVKGKKEISLLYVGKIEEQKGVFRLIEDVKKLPKNLHLLIVGSGEREEKLKKEIEGVTNIKYTGQKSKTELNDYYKNADILVVPSLCFENRPQVIIEAYKNNLPVIAHKIGGIPEIVINGETGMLIDNKDRLSFQNIFK